MSDMTACLNDLSYIPPNNEQNKPTQGDIGKLIDSIFNEMLDFFQNVFPTTKGYKLPPSYYATKTTFKMIGLGYESIHACVNDCFLFRGEYHKDKQLCPVCNTSRWKDSNTPGKKVPKKVLRYFSIIPRLQRLCKFSHTAKEMTWHATRKCMEPGKMQHPVDGRAWKNFDTKYPDFVKEPRNVRLGLAADGFNPFDNLSQSYSMWPVILTTYNLPPWLCMKESSFMLTLLIPGPKSLGKDIDVYLRPLIDDLKDLWAKPGVETIDVATGQKFNMRAMKKSLNFHSLTLAIEKTTTTTTSRHSPPPQNPPQSPRHSPPPPQNPPPSPPFTCTRALFIFEKVRKYFVRNKAKPKGSIAEGYVAEEAFIFSSHYFWDVTTKFNRPDRNVDCPPPTCQFQVFRSVCKLIGLRSIIRIDHQELKKVIWYVLHNSPEIDMYWVKFKSQFLNKDMKEEFSGWFGSRDERRTTQNSGICSPGDDGEMYYGQLEQILDTSNKSWQMDDPDVIHVDNSSDLALTTSLNDLEIVTLHIDGQSIDVDAPPDIIDVDEDDDIIDDKDVLPHDLTYSDDEDLVNVDDDDGVAVVYSSEEED
ncbi:reverse transcriptase domain-containing protein [Tanacetum coccineum]